MKVNKQRIVILTANFGSGHTSVAKSIEQQLSETYEGSAIDVVDLFDIVSPLIKDELYKGYGILVKNTAEIYNFFYEKRVYNDTVFDKIFYSLAMKNFVQFIMEKDTKLIISTFPMCSGMVASYKKKYNDPVSLITCITDVVDNQEWVFEETNQYLVASEEVKRNLISRKVAAEKIVVTGIPVRKEFYLNSEKNDIRLSRLKDRLGINIGESIVLIMGGGMGLLPEEEEVYLKLNELQNTKVIIIVGRNERLHELLDNKDRFPNIIALGFTNEIRDLMKISDIYLTKPGGISVFEAIHAEIPLLVHKANLGQERENIHFIKNRHIGCVANNKEEMFMYLNHMLRDKKVLDVYKENMKQVKSMMVSDKLCEHVFDAYLI